MDTKTETVEDLIKSARANPSEDIARRIMTEAGAGNSPDIVSAVLKAAGVSDDVIQKTISTSTGLVAYDLQAPAKNLYPVDTYP